MKSRHWRKWIEGYEHIKKVHYSYDRDLVEIECSKGNYIGFSIWIRCHIEAHELNINRNNIKKDIYLRVDGPGDYKNFPSNMEYMNEIKNLFSGYAALENPAIPDIWEVCTDIICESSIGFPSLSWIPDFPEQFNQGNYTEALAILTKLQDYKYMAPIWTACKMLDDHLCTGEKLPDNFIIGQFNFETLIEWYQEITEVNSNYKQANYRLYHIYLMSLENQALTRKDKKNLFLFALRSNDQELKDIAYHSLCEANPHNKIFKDIQVNEKTIINVGHHIASLNLQIEALKNEIEQLKQKPENHTTTPRIYEKSTQTLMPSPRQIKMTNHEENNISHRK